MDPPLDHASEPAAPGPPAPPCPIHSLPGLTVAYDRLRIARHGRRGRPDVPLLGGVTGLSGTFAAGTATLIVGSAGGGSTLFLRALARRHLPADLAVGGAITYNGATPEQLEASNVELSRLLAFAGEDDAHEPLLTVSETFAFTYRMTVPPAWRVVDEGEGTMPRCCPYAPVTPREALEALALTGAANTYIGSQMARGVSGGEKRRATIGESGLLASARGYFLDSITTGLDAAVAESVIRRLVGIAHATQAVVVVALQQPTPAIVAAFDEVLLLSGGLEIYHGPTAALETYLASLRFTRPLQMDIADYSSELVASPPRAAYLSLAFGGGGRGGKRGKAAAGAELPALLTIHELADAWAAAAPVWQYRGGGTQATSATIVRALMTTRSRPVSPQHPLLSRINGAEVAIPPQCLVQPSSPTTTTTTTQPFGFPLITPFALALYGRRPRRVSWPVSLAVLLARQTKIVYRNRALLIARIVNVTIMGCVLGTLALQPPRSAFQLRAGLSFYATIFIAFSNNAETPFAMESRAVVYKQTSAGLFRPLPYVIAVVLSFLPIAIVADLIFASLVYWMCGYYPSVARFFFFVLVLFLIDISIAAFFRSQVYAWPKQEFTAAIGLAFISVFILFAGFFAISSTIVPWLAWLIYISPFHWALAALLGNEFLSPAYAAPAPGGTGGTLGTSILTLYGFPTSSSAKWFGVLFLGCFFLLFAFVLTPLAVRYCRYEYKPGTARRAGQSNGGVVVGGAAAGAAAATAGTPAAIAASPAEVAAADAALVATSPGAAYDTDDTAVLSNRGLASIALGLPGGVLGSGPWVGTSRSGRGEATQPTAVLEGEEEEGAQENGSGAVCERGEAVTAEVSALGPASPPPPAALALVAAAGGTFAIELGSVATLPFQRATLAFSDVVYSINVSGSSAGGQSRQGRRWWGGRGGGGSAGPATKTLLQGVSGWARPGTLTALLGASGAGKTTLLDLLAFRKTQGTFTGAISVNGVPVSPALLASVAGYAEQEDILLPTATVEESLLFSAGLRMPASVSSAARRAFVADVLRVLELAPLANKRVSSLGRGERKILNAGIELASLPSILFLDEPTTNLTAEASTALVRILRRVALSGRAIVATIHQPSLEVFSAFDAACLLAPGGHQVYFGALESRLEALVMRGEAVEEGDSNGGAAAAGAALTPPAAASPRQPPSKATAADAVVTYMESIPGVPPLPPATNPATWLLTVTAAQAEAAAAAETAGGATTSASPAAAVPTPQQFAAAFAASALGQTVAATAAALAHDTPETHGVEALTGGGSTSAATAAATAAPRAAPLVRVASSASRAAKTARPFPVQLGYVLRRSVLDYARNRELWGTRLVVFLFLALLFSFLFLGTDPLTFAGTQSQLGFCIGATAFSGSIFFSSSVTMLFERRRVFYRERAAGFYHPLAYALTAFLVELPQVIALAFLFMCIAYWIAIHSSFGTFLWFSLGGAVLGAFYLSTALAYSALLPVLPVAQIAGGLTISVTMLFSGLFIPYQTIPAGWIGLYYAVPTSHLLRALSTQLFHCAGGAAAGCPQISLVTSTGSVSVDRYSYVSTFVGSTYEKRWGEMGWAALAVAVMLSIGVLALVFITHEKR